jgi:cobyrinic acid a,c-diamide synthase
MGPTLAAVVRGVENFDLKVEFAGVVLNRVGSVNHADVLRAAAAQACRTPVIGTLHRRADIEVPSRHLGLAMGHEGVLPRERLEALADAFESAVSLESLLAETAPVELPAPPPAPTPGRRVRVALARDGAFCFYYEDNLRLLADAGAEWVEFSPLHDRALPANVAALYLGGGYPELHAAALSANEPMQAAIRAFVEAGRSVWAECGGLMYLGESLTTVDGAGHRMAGVLPIATAMQPRRQALRYFSVRAAGGHPLLPEGAVLRGHEFHYSKIVREPPGSRRPAYRLDEPPGGEGFLVGGTAASYIHVHLGADPALAPAIVERLARGNR